MDGWISRSIHPSVVMIWCWSLCYVALSSKIQDSSLLRAILAFVSSESVSATVTSSFLISWFFRSRSWSCSFSFISAISSWARRMESSSALATWKTLGFGLFSFCSEIWVIWESRIFSSSFKSLILLCCVGFGEKCTWKEGSHEYIHQDE